MRYSGSAGTPGPYDPSVRGCRCSRVASRRRSASLVVRARARALAARGLVVAAERVEQLGAGGVEEVVAVAAGRRGSSTGAQRGLDLRGPSWDMRHRPVEPDDGRGVVPGRAPRTASRSGASRSRSHDGAVAWQAGDGGLQLVRPGAAQRRGALEHRLAGGDGGVVPAATGPGRAAAPGRRRRRTARRRGRAGTSAARPAPTPRPRAGRLVATTPASQTASPARSRSWVAPSEETKPSLYISVDHRQHVGEPLGQHVGRRARRARCRPSTILRLARTIRWASVRSLTRNARAICGVVMPTTARRVSASRASGAERRVAAREEQREPVVGARPSATAPGRRRLGRSRPSAPLARAAADAGRGRCVAPRPAARRPGCPAARRAASLERLDHRGLHGLLGEVEVAEPAGQPGHQQTGLLAQGVREEAVGRACGRASLELASSPRPSAGSRRRRRAAPGCGQVLVSAIAASMSGTSMTLKPPTISLASLNGPSTTTGPSSPCSTRGRGLDTEQLGAAVGDDGAVLLEPLVDLLVDRLGPSSGSTVASRSGREVNIRTYFMVDPFRRALGRFRGKCSPRTAPVVRPKSTGAAGNFLPGLSSGGAELS